MLLNLKLIFSREDFGDLLGRLALLDGKLLLLIVGVLEDLLWKVKAVA